MVAPSTASAAVTSDDDGEPEWTQPGARRQETLQLTDLDVPTQADAAARLAFAVVAGGEGKLVGPAGRQASQG